MLYCLSPSLALNFISEVSEKENHSKCRSVPKLRKNHVSGCVLLNSKERRLEESFLSSDKVCLVMVGRGGEGRGAQSGLEKRCGGIQSLSPLCCEFGSCPNRFWVQPHV